MLIKTRGIVFKTLKYGETSLIVDIYTEECGLRKYIINGVRSKKAKVQASLLQVMTLVDLVAYNRDDRSLNRIKEIKSSRVYQSIPFDVRKGAVGLFMAEVARKTLRESEENRELFNFLFDSFLFLDATTNSIANLHLHFLLELSVFLGFIPGGHQDKTTPYFDMQEGVFVKQPPAHMYFLEERQSQLLDQLLNCQFQQCHTIQLSREERRVLLRHILEYYQLHIENLPEIKAHLILQEVLGG